MFPFVELHCHNPGRLKATALPIRHHILLDTLGNCTIFQQTPSIEACQKTKTAGWHSHRRFRSRLAPQEPAEIKVSMASLKRTTASQ